MGKSCIVTKTPSSQDYLTDQEDAIFVRPYDANDLADKIDMLLKDDSLNNNIGFKARRTIEARYTERNMAEQMFNFISSISVSLSGN